VDYADNDQGSDRSAQHDIPWQIHKAPRKRSGQVHGSKPFFTFWGSMLKLTISCDRVLFFIGGPSTCLSRAKLADRRWRDHKGTSHPNRGCTRHAGQLAAHPPTQSLCISTMPAPPGIAVVGRQVMIEFYYNNTHIPYTSHALNARILGFWTHLRYHCGESILKHFRVSVYHCTRDLVTLECSSSLRLV
jgi:hypothetical protein